ncbi:hypothetical protein DXA24_15525 [Bacteroides sp. CF01-10NS]|nr:hypothetical protein DXA24_15525 [Bacteroides sp. CF01-10NS]
MKLPPFARNSLIHWRDREKVKEKTKRLKRNIQREDLFDSVVNLSHTVMSYFFPLIYVLFLAEIRRFSLHLSG